MKHWNMDDVRWDTFDPARVDSKVIPIIKAAALVERNGDDYSRYLTKVFADDPNFIEASENWGVEEMQHGDALGRWGELADPGWSYTRSFQRYKDGYKIDAGSSGSIRGSRTGELIARCMVETGTSSYYTALGDSTQEPVLAQICRLIAADEYRHFKLFYDHMRRYLAREKIGLLRRLRIAAGRITESEDDELAFAYHCGNEPTDMPYEHERCIAGYMSRAMGFYRPRHVQRANSMVLKSVGLPPQGRLATATTRLGWNLLQRRIRKFDRSLSRRPAFQQAGTMPVPGTAD